MIDCNIVIDFESGRLTHPLPRVVLTSSKFGPPLINFEVGVELSEQLTALLFIHY